MVLAQCQRRCWVRKREVSAGCCVRVSDVCVRRISVCPRVSSVAVWQRHGCLRVHVCLYPSVNFVCVSQHVCASERRPRVEQELQPDVEQRAAAGGG
eukprot:347408-Rhodomonas_salina.4